MWKSKFINYTNLLMISAVFLIPTSSSHAMMDEGLITPHTYSKSIKGDIAEGTEASILGTTNTIKIPKLTEKEVKNGASQQLHSYLFPEGDTPEGEDLEKRVTIWTHALSLIQDLDFFQSKLVVLTVLKGTVGQIKAIGENPESFAIGGSYRTRLDYLEKLLAATEEQLRALGKYGSHFTQGLKDADRRDVLKVVLKGTGEQIESLASTEILPNMLRGFRIAKIERFYQEGKTFK